MTLHVEKLPALGFKWLESRVAVVKEKFASPLSVPARAGGGVRCESTHRSAYR